VETEASEVSAELADDIADGLRDQGIGADVAYDGSAAIENDKTCCMKSTSR